MSYKSDRDGNVYNAEGERLGHYEEDSKTFLLKDESFGNYKVQISRFLNKCGTPVEFWDCEGAEKAETKEDEPPAEDIPPRPKEDPRMGDKTPALVRWLERYRFSEFKSRYQVRGRGVVPRFEADVDTGERRFAGNEEIYIAGRKTILTELAVPGSEITEEFDNGGDN